MPSLKRPTVSPLSEDGWFGVNTVIRKGRISQTNSQVKKNCTRTCGS